MAKKLKKAAALLLALCMALSLSVTAFAAEETEAVVSNQVGDYLAYDSDGNSGAYTNVTLKTTEDGKVTLSKTIQQTGKDAFDITLHVTTTEDLEVIKKARDAAIVIVMDVSGSMQFAMDGGGFCATCNNDKYYTDAYKCCHGGWQSAWAVPGKLDQNGDDHGDTRFALMESAVSVFLNDFADETGTAKRMVSMVCYNDKVEKELGWVNVTEADGMAAAQDVVAPGALAALTGGDTNTSLGLHYANEYLKDAAVKGIENTYVLLLTDGAPYTAIQYKADGTINPRVSGVGYDCDLTKAAADKLKEDHKNTEVYTVCFGYQGKEWTATHSIVNGVLTGADKNFNIDELMADIATEGCFFRGENVNEFKLSLGSIVEETVSSGAKLWTVTDPMGDYIDFDAVYGAPPAVFEDGILSWDLLAEKPVSVENGIYTYTMKYSITLNTKAEGFEFDTLYPANKATSLEYALVENNELTDIKTDYFNVPTVFATENKDFTVTFKPGTASHICFLYIDKETGEVIYDSKIDFNDGDTSAEIPAKDGYISAVFIKQAQSGMIWTAEEVDAETKNDIIESVKTNDKAYKGHDAEVFGEGNHDLTYTNGKKAKTKTVTYVFTDSD